MSPNESQSSESRSEQLVERDDLDSQIDGARQQLAALQSKLATLENIGVIGSVRRHE